MTPGAGVLVLEHGHICYEMKLLYIFCGLGHGSDKLRVVMRIKEGPTKILNLMTPWAAGVFELGHGLYESYSENSVFLLLFFSTLGHGSDEMITREGST